MLKIPGYLGAVAIAWTVAAPAIAQDVTADTVLATVAGTDITLGHVIVLRETLPEQYQNLEDDVLFPGILDQLVQQAVLANTLESESPVIRLKLENEHRSLRAGSALGLAMAAAVTDEAVAAAYEEQYAGVAPDKEFNASHILVETEEEATALIAQLADGADFPDLAKEHSTGPSGPNGGELGWFTDGMMVQPFQDAVADMESGGISAPVQTQFGWHVITLNETRLLEVPSLEDVRVELAQKIQDDAVDATIEQLMGTTEVTRTDLTGFDFSAMHDLTLVE